MNDYTRPSYPQNTYKALTVDSSDGKIHRYVEESFWEFYDCWQEYVSEFEDDLFFI